MKELALHEKTWLAAAIDGEGCVQMCLTRSHPKQVKPTLYIAPEVTVTNTNLMFSKRCLELTGLGCIRIKKPQKSTHHIAFNWVVTRPIKRPDLMKEVEQKICQQ